MSVSIKCENASCGKVFELDPQFMGQRVKCPFCSLEQVVGSNAGVGESPTVPAPTKPCPFCGQQILAVAKKCRYCGKYLVDGPRNFATVPPDPDELRREYESLRTQRRTDSILSIVIGLPGLIMSVGSQIPDAMNHRREPSVLSVVLALSGIVLLAIGLTFAAKHKGRNPAWGLVGLLSCIGLLFMLVLKDYHAERMTEIKATLAAMGQHL